MLFVLDIGTTTLKAALMDSQGRLEGKTGIPIGFAKVESPGHQEADPIQWIHALGRAYGELSKGRKLDLDAISVSGNGPTLVSVGKDGEPLGNAMSWMDRRGVAEAAVIKEKAGFYVDPTFYLPKALWVKNNKPDLFNKVQHFLACPEFIIQHLTGEAHTILPGNDFLRYFWTDGLLDSLGLERNLFPDFIDPGTRCGTVRRAIEKETGIPAGTPVFAGGPDFVMSLLGTASVYPGRACDRAGTSEGINLCTESLIQDERLMGYGHVIKGLYNVSGIISTSGKAFEWVLGILGMQNAAYEAVFEKAAAAKPGARGLLFLPYLTGERAPHWDPALRGCMFGLSLFHDTADILRAVLESTGFAMRDVIEVIEDNGVTIEDLRITGNPSRSGIWNRIKADITGKAIRVPEDPDTELSGDACVALYGLGRFDSLQQASDKTVKFGQVVEPEAGQMGLYNELFEIYRELHLKTADAAHHISDIQNTEET